LVETLLYKNRENFRNAIQKFRLISLHFREIVKNRKKLTDFWLVENSMISETMSLQVHP